MGILQTNHKESPSPHELHIYMYISMMSEEEVEHLRPLSPTSRSAPWVVETVKADEADVGLSYYHCYHFYKYNNTTVITLILTIAILTLGSHL